MAYIRFEDTEGQVRFGTQLDGGRATIVEGSIAGGVLETTDTAAVNKLLAPVLPVNIFAIGLNYGRHAMETGAKLPDHPVVFMKATSAINNPGDPIRPPACSVAGPETDYEGELAVIIGTTARNVSVETALDHVFGFTCANDVSARRWQKHAGGGQFVRGKSFDTFCPLGPRILTLAEIGNPQNLEITTRLNGAVMQQSNTGDMLRTCAQLVAFLSQDTTLAPGTVILTGTPDGVGFVRQPPVFLMPGDVIEVEIEKIGVLRNPVAAPI